ncbi:MAG: hypothetical protein WBF67_07115, partial [Olleya sp.]
MKKNLTIILLTAILLSSCIEHSEKYTSDKQIIQNEFSELIALGAYPNYYYNLANELNNVGRTELAIEAYKNCIKTSSSQTFVEDAMFNLSTLYFETQQDALAYPLMDSLINRHYTWLRWYKNSENPFSQDPAYLSRIEKIDSLQELRNNPINCKFHYQDVSNFLVAFDKSKNSW